MTTTNDTDRVVADHVIGDHGRLVVRLASAEIRLAAIEGDRVIVRTPDGRPVPDRVIVEPSDDGLTIREQDGHGPAGGGRRTVQLEISAPGRAEVAIDTASGWVDARGFSGDQRYRAVSGEVRVREGAGRIELNTVSGDATIELAGDTDFALKAVSGDATVRGGRLTALRVATTSGDVRLDSPLVGASGNRIETMSGDVELVAGAGIRIEARTISGDLRSDLPHTSDGRMGRRTMVVGDGSIELDFRSVSGDLRIHDGSRRPRVPVPPVPPVAPRPSVPPAAPFGADQERDAGFDLPDLDVAGFDLPDLAALVAPAAGQMTGPASDPVEAERMEILRALERGELDVPTAMDRLNALDGDPDPTGEADDD